MNPKYPKTIAFERMFQQLPQKYILIKFLWRTSREKIILKVWTENLNEQKKKKKKITASKLQLSIVSTMTVFPLCICRRENRMHIYKSGMPTCHSSVPNPLLLKISALQRKQQRPRINNWSYWTSSITQIKKNGSYLPIMDQQCDY